MDNYGGNVMDRGRKLLIINGLYNIAPRIEFFGAIRVIICVV